MKDKDFEKDIELEEDLEDAEIVTLLDEETGKEIDFVTIASLEYEGKLYVFLTPEMPDENIGEDEIVIMEVVEKDGEETLEFVEDEELLNKLFDAFQAEMDSEDEYGDECDCDCDDCDEECDEDCDCGCCGDK